MMESLFGKLYWVTTDHHTGKRIYEFDKAAFRFAVSTRAEEVYRTDYFNGYFDPACMKIIPMQYQRQAYPREKLKRQIRSRIFLALCRKPM